MERQISRAAARPHHGGGTSGGREDCWSEGATGTLIEAWGDRYVRLNRGNLRQKDWKEVADAVNGRQNGVRPQKTDVQCKNRVDTLKKKYKLEKSKPLPSKWNFFNRLDSLIGSNGITSKKSRAVTSAIKSSKPKLISNLNQGMYSAGSSRLNSSGGGSTESSLGLEDDNDEEDEDLGFDQKPGKKEQMGTADSSDGAAYRDLARSILKFGEIYERIESSKQQQMVELEKQRMEFTKDLEFQRMNMFMDAQMELEKINRPKKYVSGSGFTGKKS